MLASAVLAEFESADGVWLLTVVTTAMTSTVAVVLLTRSVVKPLFSAVCSDAALAIMPLASTLDVETASASVPKAI